MEIELFQTNKFDPRLRKRMSCHYSQPKGFVGRSICYAVLYDGVYYGHIVAGSATKHLRGRHEFLGTTPESLNQIINNVFFSVRPVGLKYPIRNFTTKTVEKFVQVSSVQWEEKYGDNVVGFETLIEKPRTGELYLRAGWTVVGETKGFTCKRVGGNGTDSWGGKRVWNTDPDQLRPKLVLCYKL